MKPRLLMLTHRVPYPPNRGDRIRSWQMLKYLSTRAEVSLAAIADEPVSDETRAALARHCAHVALCPVGGLLRPMRGGASLARGRSVSEGMFHSRLLQHTIDAWGAAKPFDAAFVYSSAMFPYVDRAIWRETARFVDLIDVDSRKWMDYRDATRGPRRWLFAREAAAIARLERRIVAAADVVAVTTEQEAGLLRFMQPEARPLVITNGVDLPEPSERSAALPGRVAFVGVMNYRPNVEGMLWFVKNAWRAIRERVPAASLEIVGRAPATEIRNLHGRDGIQIAADVCDVAPHLAAAEVVIAPLSIARGVQNKVLEAFAAERAVVASPAVCRGLATTAGRELLCADAAAEWVESVAGLLGNPSERRALAARGRSYVEAHHDWTSCLAPLGVWLEQFATPTVETATPQPEIAAFA